MNRFIYQLDVFFSSSLSSGRYYATLSIDQGEGCKAAILAGWMATGGYSWKEDPSEGTIITENWVNGYSVSMFCISKMLCVRQKKPGELYLYIVYTVYSQLYTHDPLQQLNVKQSQSSGDKETVTFTGQVLMTQLQLQTWLMLNLTR